MDNCACSNADIFKAIRKAGWKGGSKPKPKKKRKSKPTSPPDHIWKYLLANGNPHNIYRWNETADYDKDYRQQPGRRGKILPLYSNQLDPERELYIVEGETSVDAMRSAGFQATTWAMGCGNEQQTDWTAIKQFKKVTLWPDNDDQGRAAMRRINEKLGGNCDFLLAMKWHDAADYPTPESLKSAVESAERTPASEIPATAAQVEQPAKLRDLVFDVGAKRTSTNFEIAMQHLGFASRFNLRNRKIEWNKGSGFGDHANNGINPEFLRAEILMRFCEHVFFKIIKDSPQPDGTSKKVAIDSPWEIGDARFDRYTKGGISMNPETRWVDGFKVDFLDKLPPNEGKIDRSTILDRFFNGLADCPIRQWASRYIFDAPVWLAVHGGGMLHEHPLFIGETGIGKSHLLRWLFPPEFRREYHSGNLDMSKDEKHIAAAIQGKVIVENAESLGVTNSNIDKLNVVLSMEDFNERLAYRRDSEALPVLQTIILTTNRWDSLPDSEHGNRRIVPVDLRGGRKIEWEHELTRDEFNQCWRQSYDYIKAGGRPHLPKELWKQAEHLQECHRSRSDVEDVIRRLIAGKIKISGMSISEIWSHAYPDGNKRPMRKDERDKLAKALRHNGYKQKSVRNQEGKGYEVWVPIDANHPST